MACKIDRTSICTFSPAWGKEYQVLNGVHDQKEVKKYCSEFAEFRDKIICPWYEEGGYCPGKDRLTDLSSLKANWAFVSFSPSRRRECAASPDTGL